MKTAMAIVVSDEQRAVLESMVRSQTIDVRAARRARIVLLAGQGMGDREIARELGVGRIQVARWRARFADGGVGAIQADLPRSGRKRRIDAAEIVRVTTQRVPATGARASWPPSWASRIPRCSRYGVPMASSRT
jgi:hypothetical protein